MSMNLEMQDLMALLKQFQESECCELEFAAGDVNFAVRKFVSDHDPSRNKTDVFDGSKEVISQDEPERQDDLTGQNSQDSSPADEKNREHYVEQKAPLAGIFYRAPAPGEAPYVTKGSSVKKGETVGLLEAMKIINEVTAPCDGIVLDIPARDGDVVEYDSVLMRFEEKANV